MQEEVEATRAEKILAAAFVLFLLIGGVRVLGELREVPAKPELWHFEARYAVQELERNLSELGIEVHSLEQAYRRAQEKYLRAREDYLFKREEYRTRIEEGTLDERLRAEYEQAKVSYEAALRSRDAAREKLEAARQSLGALEAELSQRREKARREYAAAMRVYELKVLLLRLGFVLPLFLTSLYVAQLARRRRSRYAVHANSFMAFSTLLLGYMLIEYTWRSFHVIGVSAIGALATGVALAYLKREYLSRERIAMARLSRKRCPYCSFPFESGDVYCRNCGLRLLVACDNCGALRSRFTSYCQSCGSPMRGEGNEGD